MSLQFLVRCIELRYLLLQLLKLRLEPLRTRRPVFLRGSRRRRSRGPVRSSLVGTGS